ncbi:MAG: signal peptidase I [Candidatus Levyibacteriota bacterium]
MEFWKKAYAFTLDLLQTICLAAAIFLVIYIFLYRPFQVSGDSMYPTFKDKEYIMTDMISLKLGDPHRGDVIVFKAPTDNEKDFIKRVIGLPGDTVLVKDGFVYLNGKKLDESVYLHPDVRTYGGNFLHDGQPFTVPPGNYIVFGDNRPFSSDSREWGLLTRKAIIGRSFFVYWPLNVIRLIHNPFPPSEQK